MVEPEYITIVEGPTPEFQEASELGIHSILEGPADCMTVFTELRTMNGPDILARCRKAWGEGRPVKLDFPDEMRLRQEVEVVAIRLREVDQYTVLKVWVRHPLEFIEIESEEDADDDFVDFDDDDEFDQPI
ncbi:MAG: hypothetical protein AAF633_11090 [Chloroflexota bacterium]